MVIIVHLALAWLLVRSIGGCTTDADSSLRQTTTDHGTCVCRVYQDAYATCYNYSCLAFPRTFQTQLNCFKLQATKIDKLYPGDFRNLTHINSLYIETNNEMVGIEPGTFKGMKNVVKLTISYNAKFSKLEEDVFEGLDNLETLILTRSGFTSFKNFTVSLQAKYLPKLKTINFRELNCPLVYKEDFEDLRGSPVINISFDNSEIKHIHPDALVALKALKNLSVSDTLLTEENLIDILRKITENNITLTSLSLNGLGLKMKASEKLFKAIANTTIKTLFLNRNNFRTINEGSLTKMPNIESLYLEQNMIINVKNNGLSNFPNLKEIHISKNKLIIIPDCILLPSLKILDISDNSKPAISYFIPDNKFPPSLEVIDLSNNNVREIRNDSLKGLIGLKKLYLSNTNMVAVEDNAFVDLPNLEYLDFGWNRFPTRTFSKYIFRGLSKLKYLSLRKCYIDHIGDIFGYLTSLETLNLEENSLTEITPNFVASLSTLKSLSLSDNKIKIWHERLFQNATLENLTISRNTFTHLTEAMLADFNDLKTVDVSGNPFHCDCDSFVEPFSSLNHDQINHIMALINKTNTYCLLPVKFENTTIVSYYFDNHEICDQDKKEKLIECLIPSLICLIFILILIGLSYLYRWHIRYWIFLTRMAISKQTQFKKRVNVQGHTNYLYDAFVSYSTEDRNFVIRLVNMLENYEPYLKLCVYERDFEVGTIISESVLESLSRSRKTLLIISESYVKSQWCVWEAQVAENHRLFFENEHGECVNDSLIMIRLGNISSKNISPMLRYLMKTRIHLQWDPAECKQKEFWEKLRNAMGKSTSNCIEEKPTF